MRSIFVLFVILFAIIVWFALDFYFGRQQHFSEKNTLFHPPRKGNAEFFSVGTQFFSTLFQDLKHAKSFIFVQFYIIRNDPIGNELLQILKNRAADGVEVYLLVDAVGSHKLPKKTIKQLRESGIFVAYSQRPKLPYLFYSLNRRNHRKITVVDSKVGYIGGFNVGEEYLGRDPRLGQWRDYHLRLTGDVLESFLEVIRFDWKVATSEDLFPPVTEPVENGAQSFQIFATNGAYMAHFFLEYIENAEQSIFIGTPYFIPGRKMVLALIAAVKRGVRVTILIPMKADHAFVKEAAFPYLLPLLHAGADVYRYYPGFYHAKVMMIDRKVCDIGTANFDKRSFYLNDEVNCLFDSPDLIHKIEKILEFDIQESERLTLPDLGNRSIIDRGKEMFALSISRFL
ncbi:cardiolipin synthase [Alkalihalobacillus sp. AL-G]|uniref:cardiolipin synthase n=1 Tax=Alkalihalobacillus sp. AL-G TaxID=2926399 RepID=UPI002729B863|nr:cardiolipin synthase [Alkalihalobacillus sp. AL-G]WLD93202.1 cardiolipin synthase [Alkalihalobacillus sp. AL-G]